ncbi:MAG: hypothetical protein M3Y21_07700 [Candidatus Eremiobacteraeota bacterium]|nr:hypothetical protein [Candidatus Eremiobacteraeota bacterium]
MRAQALLFVTIVFLVATIATAKAGCNAPEFRQFDFFIGNWLVTNKAGKRFASDRVTREFDGCGIWERWYGDSGSRGAGYSGYIPARKLWVQTFVDNDGDVLVFQGERKGRSLVIRGMSYPKQGIVEQNVVVFRPISKDEFEEYWTVAQSGESPRVAFDGFFHRVK